MLLSNMHITSLRSKFIDWTKHLDEKISQSLMQDRLLCQTHMGFVKTADKMELCIADIWVLQETV